MRYGLFTYGSRGDVQPYIALSLSLLDSGHAVTLAAPENFKGLVESYGISFHALCGNAEQMVYSPECLKVIRSGNDVAFMRFMFKMLYNIRKPLLESMLACARQVDVMVVNHLGTAIYGAVAEKLNKPFAIVQLNPPVLPTKEFAAPGLGFMSSSWYNKLTYYVVNTLLWALSKKTTNEFRMMLNLPPLNKIFYQRLINETPIVHAYSAALFKQPSDWQAHHQVTGFLSMPERAFTNQWTDASMEALSVWLKSGERPVYIGFGSIPVPNESKLKSIIAEVLTTTTHRIVLCTGWSKLTGLPLHSNLFVVDKANHQWLLPQCKAAVIHGGVGTLAAVLQAGIPVIVVSIFVDQPLWGKVIQKKKLGSHIPWRRLTTNRLLQALTVVGNSFYEHNVQHYSKALRHQNGADQAVKFLTAWFK